MKLELVSDVPEGSISERSKCYLPRDGKPSEVELGTLASGGPIMISGDRFLISRLLHSDLLYM
jgi:hypothetical protein